MPKAYPSGYNIIIIKAHLDGVGRGEWGEAHILAHKAGYVCGTYTHASRTCVCRIMCRDVYLDVTYLV